MDGFITIGAKLNTKQFDAQMLSLERRINEIEKELSDDKEIGFLSEREISDLNTELERTRNKLVQLRKEKQKAEQPQGLKQLKAGVDDFGQGLQNAVKKASKLVLGIFGIRSAFLALRRASSELASYNEEYGANLEYIRFALTQAIAPVLEYIVNLAMKLLAYINAIAQAWFGVNLFENASVDNFVKMKKGVNNVTGAVNELKKTLAGFDEINVLQEDGSVGTGGGGGGIALPTMDLANIQDIEIPEWVQWIADHKEEVLTFLGAVGIAIAGMKLASFISQIGQASGALKGLSTESNNFALGIGLVVAGVATMIDPVSKLTTKFGELTTKEKLTNTALAVLGGALEAFGLMMMGVSGPVAAVTALATEIGLSIIAEVNERNALKDLTKAHEDAVEAKKKLRDAEDDYIYAIDNQKQAQEKLIEVEGEDIGLGKQLYDSVEKGTIKYKDMSDRQKELYKAYRNTIKAEEYLDEVTKNLTESKRKDIEKSWHEIYVMDEKAGKLDEYKDKVIKAWEAQEIKTEEAQTVILDALNGMDNETRRIFTEKLPDEIKEGLNPYQYRNIWDYFLSNWQTEISKIPKMFERVFQFITNPIGAISGIYADAASHIVYGQAKGAVVYNGIPHLAVGGIINQPGRGIPIGRAIAGERGAEGVIPLTDTQQMEILGEAIGRYITINANIPVSMNGRLISRELRQVQAEQEFAYNM